MNSMDSGATRPGFNSGFCPVLDGQAQASDLTSWYLNGLIYKMGAVVPVTIKHPCKLVSVVPGTQRRLCSLSSHFCSTELHPPLLAGPLFSHPQACLSDVSVILYLQTCPFDFKLKCFRIKNKTHAGLVWGGVGEEERLTGMLVNSEIFLRAGFR